MINDAGYERFQIMGITALAAGYALNTTECSPVWAMYIGLMVFLFGTYFRSAERDRLKVIAMEDSQEMLSSFSGFICSNEVCPECESFDKCKRHDPRAGCENEVSGNV